MAETSHWGSSSLGETGEPSSPASPPALRFLWRLPQTVTAAKVTSSSPPACPTWPSTTPPCHERFWALLQLPYPESLQPRGPPKDALYVRCLFICKLQKLCLLFQKTLPQFSLPPATPAGISFFHQLLLNFSALLWIGVNCSPLQTGYREISTLARERRAQELAEVSRCALLSDPKWTPILEWMNCILMIPFFSQFRHLCWGFSLFVFVFIFILKGTNY